jgi:hypothetical protein
VPAASSIADERMSGGCPRSVFKSTIRLRFCLAIGLDIAIIDSHNEIDESQCCRCKKQAS